MCQSQTMLLLFNLHNWPSRGNLSLWIHLIFSSTFLFPECLGHMLSLLIGFLSHEGDSAGKMKQKKCCVFFLFIILLIFVFHWFHPQRMWRVSVVHMDMDFAQNQLKDGMRIRGAEPNLGQFVNMSHVVFHISLFSAVHQSKRTRCDHIHTAVYNLKRVQIFPNNFCFFWYVMSSRMLSCWVNTSLMI